MLCSDIFRDYEADYSTTLSAEEVELQADEEEEGRGTLLLILGMPSLLASSSPLTMEHGAVLLLCSFSPPPPSHPCSHLLSPHEHAVKVEIPPLLSREVSKVSAAFAFRLSQLCCFYPW